MRIALFDYKIIPTNPIGSCHRRMLMGLSREHEFVVFAVQFDNPDPDRIRFVRVPVPTRPLALLFIAFHLLAPGRVGRSQVAALVGYTSPRSLARELRALTGRSSVALATPIESETFVAELGRLLRRSSARDGDVPPSY